MDSFGTQLKSLAALPGQMVKSSFAAANAFEMKQKVRAQQNTKKPWYGSKGANGLPQYKKGGKVKKTGPAIVHKGERVLNAQQTKSFDRKFKAVTNKVQKKMSAK